MIMEYDAKSLFTSANKADVLGTGNYDVVRRCRHDDLGHVVVKCMSCGGSAPSSSNSIKE